MSETVAKQIVKKLIKLICIKNKSSLHIKNANQKIFIILNSYIIAKISSL